MLKDGYVFEQAPSVQDVQEIAEMHRHFFGDDLSGQLGVKFLKDYYKEIKSSPAGIIIICKDKGKVVGFISGLASKGDFLIKIALANLGAVLGWGIVHPLGLIRFLIRNMVLKEKEFKAELMSLAVWEEYQGQGIARRLLSELEEFFKTRQVTSYKVFTQLRQSSGARFYEKSGFHLHQEIDLLGIKARLYLRKLI